jgi:hypothetical protein
MFGDVGPALMRDCTDFGMKHDPIPNLTKNMGMQMDGDGDEIPARSRIIPLLATQCVLSGVGFGIIKHPSSYSAQTRSSKLIHSGIWHISHGHIERAHQ